MSYTPNNPVLVQSDRSVLLEVQYPRYDEAHDALAGFAANRQMFLTESGYRDTILDATELLAQPESCL
jgi:hypothetical protein